MDPAASSPPLRPGLLRRAAAGAWEVPAGFWFLARNPRLWPLAALPTMLAVLLAGTGAFAGLVLVPRIDASLGPSPGSLPEWLALPISVLLGIATIGAFAFLGLGLAFALAAPLLDELSRRVESRARGSVEDASRGLRSEILDSLRGALYFLAAAPGMFLLGFIPTWVACKIMDSVGLLRVPLKVELEGVDFALNHTFMDSVREVGSAEKAMIK